ncbi:ATP-binding protein [Bradyrhizobium sp. CCBAU 11386]|uniref:ATP-binding protein n=1 Tax=Bradyrhizobium sp. CCBAU 11386 TaxID=1630837 RepID=UPI003FA450A6
MIRQHSFRERGLLEFLCSSRPSGDGDGKGMLIVRDHATLEAAIEQSSSETRRCFGDVRLDVERYVESPRHIEVRCSVTPSVTWSLSSSANVRVQRRFQEIIEETPTLALSPELQTPICENAPTLPAECNGLDGWPRI